MKRTVWAAFAACCAVPAVAEEPLFGGAEQSPIPSIVCDTSEQLHSIVDAFEQSLEAGKARFTELFVTMNARREPTCVIMPVRAESPPADTVDLGRITFAGAEFYGRIVHVEFGSAEAYYLLLQSPSAALKNTI